VIFVCDFVRFWFVLCDFRDVGCLSNAREPVFCLFAGILDRGV